MKYACSQASRGGGGPFLRMQDACILHASSVKMDLLALQAGLVATSAAILPAGAPKTQAGHETQAAA